MEDIRELIAKTRLYYDRINRVWSPALNNFVYFTSEGRIHLLYKGNRKKRPVREQYYKLKLFPHAVSVLQKSKTIQDWRYTSSGIQYYAIVGMSSTKGPKLRVIVKRNGEGQFNYHSVMIDS